MPFTDFFGSGTALYAQLTTMFGIAISIIIWRVIYKKIGIWNYFVSPAFASAPLLLWIVFGTLDITITTRCAYAWAECEGNAASRLFFAQFGFLGGAIVSFAWISLWATIMGIIEYLAKNAQRMAKLFGDLIVLCILYGLAIGHLAGFSTWLVQTKGIVEFLDSLPNWIGIAFGLIHAVIAHVFKGQK